ncbi:MAG TPA: TonB-dependent receptor, partial [Spongiibacteraceae bacterium]|nr:TonB-dependent receptor [Spongiibacteraceae bacterium]
LFSQGFDEEEVLSYELGYKSTLLDNRVRFNAAAFRTEMDGAQTSVQTGASPNARDFLPLDDNVFQGVEFDIEAQVSESVRLTLGYSYLDTKPGSDHIDSSVGRTFLVNAFPAAPEHSLAASINHDIPLANGRLASALNYSYQDQTFSSINTADNSVLPSYSLLGFSVTWAEIRLGSLDGEFSIQAWGRNILDEEYVIVSTASWRPFGAAQVDTFGDPRTYGVTVGYSF